MKSLAIPILCALLMVAGACRSQQADLKTLIRNVESYHRDLLFERYEIAARNIRPSSRAAWLDAVKSQDLKFTEIEIVSSGQCETSDVENREEIENCAVVESSVQWYAGGTPTVHSARVRTVWQYFKDAGWLIIEQDQY